MTNSNLQDVHRLARQKQTIKSMHNSNDIKSTIHPTHSWKHPMPWFKITLTEKQLSTYENEKLVATFQKVYHRFKSEVANMALFGVEGDNCTFYLNASASSCCEEIKKFYPGKEAKPAKQMRRLAGEVGPQIFES